MAIAGAGAGAMHMAHTKALAAKDEEIKKKTEESAHKDNTIAHDEADKAEKDKEIEAGKEKLAEEDAALAAANAKTNELEHEVEAEKEQHQDEKMDH